MFAVALNVKGGINRCYANMQFMQNAIYVKKICKFRYDLNNRLYKYVIEDKICRAIRKIFLNILEF